MGYFVGNEFNQNLLHSYSQSNSCIATANDIGIHYKHPDLNNVSCALLKRGSTTKKNYAVGIFMIMIAFLEHNDCIMNCHKFCANCKQRVVYVQNDDSSIKMGQSSEKVGL